MSQSSILVEDGGNGNHNPHEDSVQGCETEAEDPELGRPFSYHEAKITTRIVMNRNLQVGLLQSQRDHPVAWANGTKDRLLSLHVERDEVT